MVRSRRGSASSAVVAGPRVRNRGQGTPATGHHPVSDTQTVPEKRRRERKGNVLPERPRSDKEPSDLSGVG